MPLWLRRSLIALAVLIALLVAGAAWLVASFDPNRYKGLLIDWVRDNKQRSLVIDGPIGLSVFPRIEVTLQDVSLSEHRRPEQTFASLKDAQLAVQLMPLLRRELAIDRVAASGVRVTYARNAKGESNIDDLLASDAPDGAEAPASEAEAPALRFDVSGIELSDLQADVRDEVLGIDGRFAVKTLETGRLADGAESPVRFVGHAQLKEPALDAAIDLAGDLALTLPADAPASIGFTDLKLGVLGQGFDVKKLDARLTGTLAYDGKSGAARADDLQLLVSGERLGMALQDSAVRLASLVFDPERRALSLEKLDLQLKGRSGEDTVAATLGWPSLKVAGDTLEGSALKGSATVEARGADPRKLQLGFESQAPSGSFESIRVPGLKVTINGSGAGRSVRGEARTDLSLAPQPLAAALQALALEVAFTDPALPPMKLAMRGQAEVTADKAAWGFDGSINEQKFNTSGKADLSKDVPRIEAQARFATLDLTRFVAKPPAGAKPAAQTKPSQGSGADAPVDLSGLKAIDGAFQFRAGTLVYPPYRVADAALDATLAGGSLRVSQLSGRAWGGRFNAQASAQAASGLPSQRMSLKLDASDVDIAQLLGDVADFRKLEGKGRVTADVSTRGASVDQLKQQLGGKAAMRLTDGAVRGINLAKVLRQWKSAVTLDKDAVQAASAEEKTDFSEISGSFDIQNGVARNKDLSAKSPFLRVGGEGLIDIGKSRIDYLAKATVTATSEGQGGAELAALRGVTVPVQLVGPFESVDYRIQWSAVAADMVGKRARDAVADKAKGALGGVLGGLGKAAPVDKAASAPAKKDRLEDGLNKLFGR
jgi:AsmA protein